MKNAILGVVVLFAWTIPILYIRESFGLSDIWTAIIGVIWTIAGVYTLKEIHEEGDERGRRQEQIERNEP